MTTCIKVEQSPGCWTKANGETENVLVVREYGTGADGQAVLVRTHFTDVNGDHVVLGVDEFIRLGACLACCGDVVISNINQPGNRIATITLANGQTVDINETITKLQNFSLTGDSLSIEYLDEAGDVTTKTVDLSPVLGDQYKTTSTTCQEIVSTGNITLTVQAGLAYTPLQDIIVYADANNYMHGQVVSYNTNTGVLVMEVHQKTGSGTYCNWTVNLDAIKVSEVSVYFGTTSPIVAGQAGVEGDFWYVTDTGTNSGAISESWVYDGTAWVPVPLGCTTRNIQESFTATAGQTSFTISQTPVDDVLFIRNGSTLKKTARTVSGTTVTYDPAANNNNALVAGDDIEIFYTYEDCSGSAPAGVYVTNVTLIDPATLDVSYTSGPSTQLTINDVFE